MYYQLNDFTYVINAFRHCLQTNAQIPRFYPIFILIGCAFLIQQRNIQLHIFNKQNRYKMRNEEIQ